jgi:hypothetical protein
MARRFRTSLLASQPGLVDAEHVFAENSAVAPNTPSSPMTNSFPAGKPVMRVILRLLNGIFATLAPAKKSEIFYVVQLFMQADIIRHLFPIIQWLYPDSHAVDKFNPFGQSVSVFVATRGLDGSKLPVAALAFSQPGRRQC